MVTKKIFALVATGTVLGLGIGFPAARASQPVKVETKTVTKTVVSQHKIDNGITLNQVAALLGTPLGQTVKPTQANNYTSCIAFRGVDTSGQAKVGDWQITVCAKVR